MRSKTLRNWMGGVGLFLLGMSSTGCASHGHDHDPSRDIIITDDSGLNHEGYYDDQHHWHGGYYDKQHVHHDDPADWRDSGIKPLNSY